LLLYWSRAVEEVFWFRFSPAIFVVCVPLEPSYASGRMSCSAAHP
jgi:hypothetical protein